MMKNFTSRRIACPTECTQIVPKEAGVFETSLYWISVELARTIVAMTPEQAGKEDRIAVQLNGTTSFWRPPNS